MEERIVKERVISLDELFFEILLKWRMIIIFMIIGGVLFGGYSYFQSTQNAETQKNQAMMSDADILNTLENTLTDREKVLARVALEHSAYSEYYNESLLMHIDANNVPTMDLVFDVKTLEEKTRENLVEIYEQSFETGVSDWLFQNGMEEAKAFQANELIITENEIKKQLKQTLDEKDGIISIKVVHVDEDSCKALAKQVKEYVFAQKGRLEEIYGPHEVILVSESYARLVNADLLEYQRSILANIQASNTYYEQLTSKFSATQIEYMDLFKKSKMDETESVQTNEIVSANPSINLKYVLLGMVLFAFIYVFYAFGAYILNNKLHTNDDLNELYGIVQLGTIYTENSKKRFLGFIDAGLIAIRDRNKRKFTEDETEEIVAVAIKMAVKKSGDKAVGFIGCDVKKQTEEKFNSIRELLEKEDIKVTMLDNVLYNAEQMEKLANISNVVLIEKAGSTMYDEVTKELELIERYNINVLGGILVE